ncbi:MAG TPA: ABC transporter permease [Pseudogracilibacillus sp.]|nr:ABC transporter permease [Pseudogracilibacillus sp.]
MNKYIHVFSIGFFCFLLIVWELVARGMSELVLPAPTVVVKTLWMGLTNGYFLPHIMRTLAEILLGLLAGSVLGIFLGLLMGEVEFLRKWLHPYIITSQAVPKLALAPLFILWFGFGMTSKVVITALICFFPLLENTLSAIQQVERSKVELFQSLRASRWQILFHLKIPSGLPQIVAGFKIAVVLAVVGAVVGEFIGGSKGLGALIIASQGMMDTPLMFAVLILLTAIGIVLYQLVILVEKVILVKYMEEK